MRIHTRTVWQIEPNGSLTPLEDEWFEYRGPVAEAGGKGGDDTQTKTTKVEPPDFALPLLTEGANQALKMLTGGQPPASAFAPTFVPPTPTQEEGLTRTAETARTTAADTAGRATEAQNFFLDPRNLDPNSNPYLAGAVEAAISPIRQEFQRTVLPGIDQEALSAGAFGGSRQGVAQGIASDQFTENVGNISSQMFSQAYREGLDRMMRGIGLTPTVQQAQLLPGQALEAVGATRRGFEQEQSEVERQQDLAEFTRLREFINLTGGLAGTGSTTTQTTPAPSHDPFTGALGGAASGAALAGTLSEMGAFGAGAAGPVGWTLAGIGALAGAFGG